VAQAEGLAALGCCSAAPFDDVRRLLERRRADGLAGGMQFTYRNPARATDPAATLPSARSLVVGALAYDPGPPAGPGTAATAGTGAIAGAASTVAEAGEGSGAVGSAPGCASGGGEPLGSVARYAWADYYSALRSALGSVGEVLRRAGWRAVVVADQNNLVDRAAAQRAGLGWYGKSTNLLVPGAGSWFVLGSIITDAELVAADPVADGCGPCRRCLDGCPTGAIVAPGVLDARRCLAWLVQAPGDFPAEYRVALGDRIYGCDDCQEVCPPNRRAPRPSSSSPASAHERTVPLLDLLDLDDATLLERYGRWYISGRDPRHLRRNALVALGNVAEPGDAAVAERLVRYLGSDDEQLARHAAWAAMRLGRADLVERAGAQDRPDIAADVAAGRAARRAELGVAP